MKPKPQGTFDAEVMIQDVNPENAMAYFGCYLYVADRRRPLHPLYLAPYFKQGCEKVVPEVQESGVSWISRVLEVREVHLRDLVRFPIGYQPSPEIRAHKYWQRWHRGILAWMQRETNARAKGEDWSKFDPQRLYFLSEPAQFCRTVKKAPGQTQLGPGFSRTLFDLLANPHLGRSES